MSQLPLFGDAPQTQPSATRSRSASEAPIVRFSQPRSPRPKPQSRRIQHSQSNLSNPTQQIVLTEAIALVARQPQCPINSQPEVPPAPAIEPEKPPADSIAPLPAKELPAGWVSPKDPNFNYLKNCRQCGWPIKHGGLDHSLCSGDCGWVIDKQWEAWDEQRRKRKKEPEPQAATHTSESSDSEALDLFTYGLEGGAE